MPEEKVPENPESALPSAIVARSVERSWGYERDWGVQVWPKASRPANRPRTVRMKAPRLVDSRRVTIKRVSSAAGAGAASARGTRAIAAKRLRIMASFGWGSG